MAKPEIAHWKSRLVLSAHFHIIKWHSCSVAKSAYYYSDNPIFAGQTFITSHLNKIPHTHPKQAWHMHYWSSISSRLVDTQSEDRIRSILSTCGFSHIIHEALCEIQEVWSMVQWGNNNIGLNQKSLHNIVFVHATVASVILSTSSQCLIQSLQTTTFHHPSL